MAAAWLPVAQRRECAANVGKAAPLTCRHQVSRGCKIGNVSRSRANANNSMNTSNRAATEHVSACILDVLFAGRALHQKTIP
jgi:hypothetical protein